MQSIHRQVLDKICELERGSIFFPEDFASIGNSESVRQALSRICREGTIIRLSKGIYLYPVIDGELGVFYPSVERIAKAISKRDKSRIVPTGAFALNRLGLSTQIPMNVIFLTDGITRKINIGKQTITFKHIHPKGLSFRGKITPLAVAALKEIGKDKALPDELLKIGKALQSEPAEIVLSDACLAPRWITDIIISLIKNPNDERVAKY
ncbi:MAG: type IV toxin-antitoxin system AbiEi family antitoxin domain-containing protein [Tannerella sp.]|nr:type IV toxin-antitoxin system AbiEi family antitoxin domain-containing protein [Tannerella sp.]